MELPKVIIRGSYADYLDGKEVEATVASKAGDVKKGMHVMAFHNSIAVNTSVTVPKDRQPQYIGMEGLVADIANARQGAAKAMRVIKL